MLVEKEKMFNPEDVIEQFEALTMDAGRVQEETLRRILQDNSETEYLRKWGLNGRTDPESFKACIPLVFHKDLEPYIQRIADGDGSPILTGKPITTISLRYPFVSLSKTFLFCFLVLFIILFFFFYSNMFGALNFG